MKRLLWVAVVVVAAVGVAWPLAAYVASRSGWHLSPEPVRVVKLYLEAGEPYRGPLVSDLDSQCGCAPPVMIPPSKRIELWPARVKGLRAIVPVRVVPTPQPDMPNLTAQPRTGEFRLVYESGWRVEYTESSLDLEGRWRRVPSTPPLIVMSTGRRLPAPEASE
jgi:hypothetical protein